MLPYIYIVNIRPFNTNKQTDKEKASTRCIHEQTTPPFRLSLPMLIFDILGLDDDIQCSLITEILSVCVPRLDLYELHKF